MGRHQVARCGRACTTPARTYLPRHDEQGMEKGQKPPEVACSSHVQPTPGDPTYYPGKPGETHRRHRWNGVRHSRSPLEVVSRGPEPSRVQTPTCQKGVHPQRQRQAKTTGHTDVSCILHLLSKFVGNR